jgi:hypothetical protein
MIWLDIRLIIYYIIIYFKDIIDKIDVRMCIYMRDKKL